MKHLLLTTIAANYGFSSIPWWCYLILFLFLFGFIKKRLGQTIHKHAIEGNIRAIKKLVNSKGMTCLEAKDEGGCSPLHYAAIGGHKEVAEYLIENNASINSSDNEGYTPLHGAAIRGHREIIDLLISKGSNVNAKAITGESVLDCALGYSFMGNECADYLKSLGCESNAKESIFIAASTGNLYAVKQHLMTGVNVNTKNGFGVSALQLAITRGYKQIVELLISEGAKIDDALMDGSTLLDSAIINGDKEIVDILRNHDAKISCGRCNKAFPYSEVRKLWRLPFIVLKLISWHTIEEGKKLYCLHCSRSQNVGTVFLMFIFAFPVMLILMAYIFKP